MSQTLYRKYRPQTFAELVYQTHVVQTLQNQLASNKVAHAYLFCGPRGLGKTTVARILAKAVNCQHPNGVEPCNECTSCTEITAGNNIDLIEIDAASNRGIEDIRELREQIKYSPVRNKYKVYIIDEVHMLTKEAFNALLKTLEEPPAHALFILATTEAHKLPETIVSRCQRFDFKKVPLTDMAVFLAKIAKQEGVSLPTEAVERVARLSQGHVRDALSLLGQVLALGATDISLATINSFLPQQFAEQLIDFVKLLLTDDQQALVFVRELVEQGVALEPFTKQLLELCRLLMVGKATADFSELDLAYSDAQKQELVELAKTLPQTSWLELVKLVAIAVQEIKTTEIATLPLEILIITFAQKLKKPSTNLPPTPPSDRQAPPSASNKETKADDPVDTGFKPIHIEAAPETPLVISPALAEVSAVLNYWLEILEEIRKSNHSVAAFIKQSHPLSLTGNILVLGFQHSFNWDRVKERKNLDIIEAAVLAKLGAKLIVQGQVDPNWADNHRLLIENIQPIEADVVADVLKEFGGDIVEVGI